jgi:oxygen-independent coproporphyrinogen-3 oxidase
VHVPFCSVRCTYCHFSTGALTPAALERWFTALAAECAQRAPAARGHRFASLFFGGGTPSTLASRHFRRLMALLHDHFEFAPGAEVTLEANPETVKPTLLATWLEAGVNRLSMGAQAFAAEDLALLGRIHGGSRPLTAVRLAREAGMPRLSLDLMFAWPGHTAAALADALARALAAEVEHLSLYAFIPEAGTALGDAVLAGDRTVPDDAAQARMYAAATAQLAAAGLHCYETSNFARPGAEARHNLVYWLRRDHLALGPSAHGLWQGERYANHHALADWAEALARGESGEAMRERPDAVAAADERLMLGLRLGDGLVRADHPAAEWEGLLARHGRGLDAAVEQGRLERTEAGWRVASGHRFVADEVIAWVAARAGR